MGKFDDLTVADLMELRGLFGGLPMPRELPAGRDDSAWEIGKNYLIRTVTMIDTGRLVAINERWIVLEDAAWIADTGRFSDALVSGDFGEVEPFPEGRIMIGCGAVIDVVPLDAPLPRVQK
jgi:hypothetical protein